ncbi:ubiquitin-activating enzyme e1 [Nannochloropsis gaditana]|uniref:Ubiquitin-like 1-activating enzyme E1A n=1 Tax=Nannochloropsis gaditana TaxID=72520 RepID=W7TG11_9STRA|nr:ubiquitin-activating enzyme e1 [Nannochloropsis gaditana]
MEEAKMSTGMEPGHENIDEGLYSRQLYVMGHEAQKRMQASDVLIVGVAGLGIEVAKNVILAGVKSVTLFDPAPVAYPDLAAQFYLSEADLGKPRDQASAPRLAELNPYVPVHVLEPEAGEALTAEAVKRYQVLCVTNRPLAEQLRLNAITHPLNIAFIASEVRGLCGSVFCDFGEAFLVSDPSDEPAINAMIGSITQPLLLPT